MSTFNGSLSCEVHYIVVEKLVAAAKEAKHSDTCSVARETLLNLRLTSREFADIAIATAVLFENLEFQATRDNLTRLKQTNVASFAPFVKEPSFLPTFYSAKR
ncbi:hypothetical protein PV04_05468 [Phialophora macrospora]|uniref:Uncharacterized protein n=1 Tax=Phialophora macrospora TaxID=1851006 RepID=A0A0D2FN12_9EURO|nr:hypothetical protein PV04_05468 [Phialophora macrospora]